VDAWLGGFAEAIQTSPFGVWAGESAYAYPVANLVHLLGLVMLVGGIGVVDLRLVGAFRSLPTAALSRVLTPVAIAGLLLMIPSGLTMFAADAKSMAASAMFQRKLVLIALALANAILFRAIWGKRVAVWDESPPTGGRLMAGASLLLWLAVAAHGRMIAYS
jgi:hypothetical protein